MSNKNAYELRFELLQLAHEINNARYNALKSTNCATDYPSIEDIINDAKKMKEFVSDNS